VFVLCDDEVTMKIIQLHSDTGNKAACWLPGVMGGTGGDIGNKWGESVY